MTFSETARNLVNACTCGKMPLLKTQADCGLDGFGGSNPVDVFACYRAAILEDKVTVLDIEKHLSDGQLGEFIMKQESVKRLSCYTRVNGLKSMWTANMSGRT